jgi:hypothetical protein
LKSRALSTDVSNEEEERRAQGAKRRRLENDRRKIERDQFDKGPSFADMTAVPVNAPHSGMSNHDVVESLRAKRTANQSAAAALKAEIMGNPSTESDTQMQDDGSEPKGTKRKADEVEDEDEINQEDTEAESTANEEPDNEAAGRAILARVAADKKAKEDAAQAKEPDDEVR